MLASTFIDLYKPEAELTLSYMEHVKYVNFAKYNNHVILRYRLLVLCRVLDVQTLPITSDNLYMFRQVDS